MNKIILQPSGNKDAREHYVDTIEKKISIDLIAGYITHIDADELRAIYPDGVCSIWGVTPSEINIKKWDRITKGDVTLFSKSGGIYASGVTTYKIHNRNLALKLWNKNAKGDTWEYIYFIDEVKKLNISYSSFNKVIGYKENFIIQGFNVLDEIKSKLLFDAFGLNSSTYIEEIEDLQYVSMLSQLKETEELYEGKRRLEQGYLRKSIFGNNTVHACSCCKKQYPISFLVCAHIKKRSRCEYDELRDMNVVMPMCKFGCDELFEKGIISVDNSGLIQQIKSISNVNVKSYIEKFIGTSINSFNSQSAEYFKWHYEFHSNYIK